MYGRKKEITATARSAQKLIDCVVQDKPAELEALLKLLREENRKNQNPAVYFIAPHLDGPDNNGWRALHWAFHLRRYSCAKLLIDAGKFT